MGMVSRLPPLTNKTLTRLYPLRFPLLLSPAPIVSVLSSQSRTPRSLSSYSPLLSLSFARLLFIPLSLRYISPSICLPAVCAPLPVSFLSMQNATGGSETKIRLQAPAMSDRDPDCRDLPARQQLIGGTEIIILNSPAHPQGGRSGPPPRPSPGAKSPARPMKIQALPGPNGPDSSHPGSIWGSGPGPGSQIQNSELPNKSMRHARPMCGSCFANKPQMHAA